MTVRVLICDSAPVIRHGLAEMLGAQSDIDVVATTDDGREAVTLVSRLSPDVLITDSAVTGMPGPEVARRALAAGGLSLQVLMFSSQLDDASIMRALEAGVYGYLPKDAAADEVVRAVRALASGGAAASGQVTRRLIDWLFWREAQPISPARHALESLTGREREVMRLVARGMSNAEIATWMSLEESTVRSHAYHLRQKLALRDRAQLIAFAYQSGFSVPTVPGVPGAQRAREGEEKDGPLRKEPG